MAVMDFYTLTDKGIEEELGNRVKALRLRKNITQKELAEATTLSLNAIKSLESGRGKLSTLIAVLRGLAAISATTAAVRWTLKTCSNPGALFPIASPSSENRSTSS